MGLTLRPGEPADLELIADNVVAGFEGYRSFARPGWEPPPRDVEVERIRGRLADAWVLLAFDGRALAGHVSLLPDEPEAGGAYLWHLFIRSRWWGRGLAPKLMHAFLAEARARGYERGRLRTPALQTRARRFYEREGWRQDGRPVYEPGLELDLVTYRRDRLT